MTKNSPDQWTIPFWLYIVPDKCIHFCVLAALKLLVGTSQHVFLHFFYKTVCYMVKIVKISSSSFKKNFHHQKALKKLHIRHYYDYLGFSNSCGIFVHFRTSAQEICAIFALFSHLKVEKLSNWLKNQDNHNNVLHVVFYELSDDASYYFNKRKWNYPIRTL